MVCQLPSRPVYFTGRQANKEYFNLNEKELLVMQLQISILGIPSSQGSKSFAFFICMYWGTLFCFFKLYWFVVTEITVFVSAIMEGSKLSSDFSAAPIFQGPWDPKITF